MLDKKEKTIAIQVRITERQKAALDMILSKNGVTQSNLIRLFLDRYIKENKELLDE